MNSRGGSGLRKRFCFFFLCGSCIPKKFHVLFWVPLHLKLINLICLRAVGVFSFLPIPGTFFFCDSLNSLESTLEIEPLQQNSPLQTRNAKTSCGRTAKEVAETFGGHGNWMELDSGDTFLEVLKVVVRFFCW